MNFWPFDQDHKIAALERRIAEQQRIIDNSHARNARQRHELRCLLEVNAWLWRRVFKGGRGMR